MEEISDFLDREKIISDLFQIIELLSEQQQGKVFALDGGWGYGKTYILGKLEKKLEPFINADTLDNKYYVFHYNCWQYDYYDEPAIAIVSSMLEKIDHETDAKIDKNINASLKTIKEKVEEIAGNFIKNKIGINIVDLFNETKNNYDEINCKEYEFDNLFAFKKTLDFTREKIKDIAKIKTIVIVVDELDRCMPAYAIKVLERLHHLFEGIDNVIVLLGIDSRQLEHSVREIYGEEVDTEKYLRKFISFKFSIDIGIVQNQIFNNYSYYFSNFKINKDIEETTLKLIELCQIDVRNLNILFEKIHLIHKMCFNKIQSGEILIFEIIWSLMNYKLILAKGNGINIENYGSMFWIPEIDHATYAGLDRCISKNIIDYLKELKKNANSNRCCIEYNTRYEEINCIYVKEDENGIAWLYLDQIFANKKTYKMIQKKEHFELIEKCKMFCEIGKTLF